MKDNNKENKKAKEKKYIYTLHLKNNKSNGGNP